MASRTTVTRVSWLAAMGAALLLIALAFAQRSASTGKSTRQAPTREESFAPELGHPGPAEPTRAELEQSIMARLRRLRDEDPASALSLALQGNLRFPTSPDAPERGWIICRSLVALERFPEAVAEARVVAEQYPGTPWAEDVEKHLLVNPMSDPAERGYGHRSELE